MRKYITFVFEIVKREEISKYFHLYNLNEKGNHYNDPCLFPFECISLFRREKIFVHVVQHKILKIFVQRMSFCWQICKHLTKNTYSRSLMLCIISVFKKNYPRFFFAVVHINGIRQKLLISELLVFPSFFFI